MGRAEKGSAKALANKTKSKGLQKLKWFCQMCQKQCRDQNGFKCHLTSESHQRQLLLFAENQGSYLRQFSREFESNFLTILKNTFGGKRIRANDVYQELIKDKGHVHMNSTVWHTLTGFIHHLQESGKCKIDETEKGWFIQLIDQEEELRKQKLQNRAKQEKTDDERMEELLQRQMERDMEKATQELLKQLEPEELVRDEGSKPIVFNFTKPIIDVKTEVKREGVNDDIKEQKLKENRNEDHSRREKPSTSSNNRSQSTKRSALNQLKMEEERFKEKRNRKDHWIHKDIVVKVVTKQLGSKYYNCKGVVNKVLDKYGAEVELDSGDVIVLDQKHLETVIPKVGRDMLIVNGAYRGEIAVLEEILEKQYSVKLRIKQGIRNGRMVEVAYEDASKYV
ncbi:UNVERIFIED_CONTAM: DNA/RNA-binding protein KIN17, partial [Eudyptes robustus]